MYRIGEAEVARVRKLIESGRMFRYGKGGEAPYPLAEACQDHCLSLKCEEALESGEEVRTETQPWAEG